MEQHTVLIVIGTSAGGMRALSIVIGGFPVDVPASVVVVQHLHPTDSYLAELLHGRSALPVRWAEAGAPIESGRVYVAPPGFHTTFDGRSIHLADRALTPEIRFTPSINLAFRSAAAVYRRRAIGVVLTGMLDDGATGLAAIRAAGGRAVVQSPTDAQYPAMPRNALATAGADFIVGLAEIASTLLQLTAT